MRNWLPVTFGLAVAAAPAAAQTQPMPIALSGAAAPSGGSYGNFGGTAVLNRSGQVAFVVGLTGGTSPAGIFLASSPGVIQTLALEGTDYTAGGVVSNLTLNAAGKAAFLSTPFAGSQGVYAGVPGSVAALAVSNTPSPAGGVYNELASPVLNDPGQVA